MHTRGTGKRRVQGRLPGGRHKEERHKEGRQTKNNMESLGNGESFGVCVSGKSKHVEGDREGKSRPKVPDARLRSLYFLLEVLKGLLKLESGDRILHFKKMALTHNGIYR